VVVSDRICHGESALRCGRIRWRTRTLTEDAGPRSRSSRPSVPLRAPRAPQFHGDGREGPHASNELLQRTEGVNCCAWSFADGPPAHSECNKRCLCGFVRDGLQPSHWPSADVIDACPSSHVKAKPGPTAQDPSAANWARRCCSLLDSPARSLFHFLYVLPTVDRFVRSSFRPLSRLSCACACAIVD
jgi:hypothetical protein